MRNGKDRGRVCWETTTLSLGSENLHRLGGGVIQRWNENELSLETMFLKSFVNHSSDLVGKESLMGYILDSVFSLYCRAPLLDEILTDVDKWPSQNDHIWSMGGNGREKVNEWLVVNVVAGGKRSTGCHDLQWSVVLEFVMVLAETSNGTLQWSIGGTFADTMGNELASRRIHAFNGHNLTREQRVRRFGVLQMRQINVDSGTSRRGAAPFQNDRSSIQLSFVCLQYRYWDRNNRDRYNNRIEQS